jgi:hypothetical protein
MLFIEAKTDRTAGHEWRETGLQGRFSFKLNLPPEAKYQTHQ